MASHETSSHSESTSLSLLARVRAEDSDAWASLSRLYSPLVYAWCRQCGVTSEDASDIVQEVFRAVHRNIGRFRRGRPDDSFRGWLWTITRNKIRDHFRVHADRPDAQGGTAAQMRLAEVPEIEPEAHESSGDFSRNAILHRGLDFVQAEFEPKTWQAFWRSLVEEEATSDIAADLGMSTGAVRKAKFRVLRRLREEFRDLED